MIDGALIATIAGVGVTGLGVVGGGFWMIWSRLGSNSKAIGRVEGTLKATLENYSGQFGAIGEDVKRLNGRMDHLDDRVNGLFESPEK